MVQLGQLRPDLRRISARGAILRQELAPPQQQKHKSAIAVFVRAAGTPEERTYLGEVWVSTARILGRICCLRQLGASFLAVDAHEGVRSDLARSFAPVTTCPPWHCVLNRTSQGRNLWRLLRCVAVAARQPRPFLSPHLHCRGAGVEGGHVRYCHISPPHGVGLACPRLRPEVTVFADWSANSTTTRPSPTIADSTPAPQSVTVTDGQVCVVLAAIGECTSGWHAHMFKRV